MISIAGSGMKMTYNYSSTQNNGQITSSVDNTSGETITYTYDALKRLLEADGLNWKEKYVYDGFGNLTQMNPSGILSGMPSIHLSIAVDANNVPNNRIAGGSDNNGNQSAGFLGTYLSYDVANRVSEVMSNSTPYHYDYDPDNRRVYYGDANGHDTIYFYGAEGRKLATYTVEPISGQPEIVLTQTSENVYFLGKLISAEGNPVSTDRLGSVRSGGPAGLGYQAQYPYGTEYTTTANDREKYATYTRDNLTGLDYAVNRYYWSQWGRFLSPDPYGGSASPGNPQSWNRYAYAGNDPANHTDPSGLFLTAEECIADPDECEAQDWGSGGGSTSDGGNGRWTGPDGPPCGFWYGTPCIFVPVDACPDPSTIGGFLPAPGSPEPWPCPTPAPPSTPSWQMQVVATSDCYRPFVGKPGVWERDVTYIADLVYDDGSTTKLTGDGTTIIKESLAYISGQRPPASSSLPGQQFFDQISVGNGSNFMLTQTFTVIYQGIPYAAQILSFFGQVSSSNDINAHRTYVDINKGANLGPGGSHPTCP